LCGWLCGAPVSGHGKSGGSSGRWQKWLLAQGALTDQMLRWLVLPPCWVQAGHLSQVRPDLVDSRVRVA